MFATSTTSLESRVFSALSAALFMLALASCSPEPEPADLPQAAQDSPDAAGSGDTADGATGNASNEATNSDREIRHPKLLAGIPVIDGDYKRGRAGRFTNGSTAFEGFNVTTGQPWQDVADEVRGQLTHAGFAETSWAAFAGARYDVRAHGIFDQGDRLIIVEVEEDGRVAYMVREMPADSYAERKYACEELVDFRVRAAALPRLAVFTTGAPLSIEQLDFTYAFVAGVAHRLPSDVATSAAALYDAVATTIGKDAKAFAPGSDLATAMDTAKAALSAATDAYCKG